MSETTTRDEIRRGAGSAAFWAACFGIWVSAAVASALDGKWLTMAVGLVGAAGTALIVRKIVRGMGVLRVSISEYLPLLSERALQGIAAECDEIVAQRRDERNRQSVDEIFRDGGGRS